MAVSPVHHISTVDPDDDWKEGLLGGLSRTWSIVSWILSNVIGMEVIRRNAKDIPLVWIVVPLSLGICGTVCLIVLRRSRKHRTLSDHKLHALFHSLRDNAATVLEKGHVNDGVKARFANFNGSAAQYIAEFFQVLASDSSVTCAIRMAKTADNGSSCYTTVARSSGMESARSSRSVDISANTGLPGKLLSAECHGVLIVADVKKAIESKEYHQTPNDSYKDCRSFIVSPINGWDDGKKVMIGILTVSSRRTNGFRQWHTTSLKAIADTLGLAYPMMLDRLKAGRRTKPDAQGTPKAPKNTSPKASKKAPKQ